MSQQGQEGPNQEDRSFSNAGGDHEGGEVVGLESKK
jgi:hypothetical protein